MNFHAKTTPPVLIPSNTTNPRQRHNIVEDMTTASKPLNWPAGSPATPRRISPNSSKKRLYAPDLSRSIPTPSHRIKMANIFQEAGLALESGRSPSRRLSPNTKRSRMPSPHHRNFTWTSLDEADPYNQQPSDMTFGIGFNRGTASISVPLSRDDGVGSMLPTPFPCHQPTDSSEKEPLSSGLSTPFPLSTIPQRHGIILPLFLDVDSEADDTHSSHGVPLIVPLQGSGQCKPKRHNIDAWLDEVLCIAPEGIATADVLAPCPSTSLTAEDDISPYHYPQKPDSHFTLPPAISSASRASSNKENIDPLESSLSRSLVASPSSLENLQGSSDYLSITPKRPSRLNPSAIGTPLNAISPPEHRPAFRFHYPGTPRGLFYLAPKRKKFKVDPKSPPSLVEANKTIGTPSNFDIHEDEEDGILPELSPQVECQHKGRGPKRERCSSYFDQDILPTLTPSKTEPSLGPEADTSGDEFRKGKRVLGESQDSAKLTKPKTFIEEAGNAKFDFNIVV